MEKEFRMWVEKEKSKPKKFQMGSKVRVFGSGNRYNFTKDGSEGIVEGSPFISNYGELTTSVEFYKFAGEKPRFGNTFPIATKCLRVI